MVRPPLPAPVISPPVIRVEHVSKCYHVYERPQDRLKQAILPRFGRLAGRGAAPRYYREFWALSDVSFELAAGEALGVIGRNGAGKSTLLQILAGTLAPSEGNVSVAGKVAALLELGSGFSPEFTGAENARLNAALLGLTPGQIDARFDEIAAFADIGDFLDQPVKTYSSGMLMRLAFAVQTAVRPDVLIVDEALSVGDVFFQAKCMARLRALLADGVSLLLVSHDPGTVRQICNRAILLAGGRLIASGSAGEVTDQYLRLELEERNRAARGAGAVATATPETPPPPPPAAPVASDVLFGMEAFTERARFNRMGNGAAKFLNVQLLRDGEPRELFDFDETVVLRQTVRFLRPARNVNVVWKVRTTQGVDVLFGDTRLAGRAGETYAADRVYTFEWRFRVPLLHGNYHVFVALSHPPATPGEDWTFLDVVPIAAQFRVAPRAAGMIDALVVLDAALDIGEHALPATLEAAA